jgi:Tol biopolymer transport system component
MKLTRFALAALVLTLTLSPTVARATYPGSNGLIVLYGSIGGSGNFVYVVNSDGSNRRALAEGRTPHWTADGQRIYFSDGAGCVFPEPVCAIYSVSVDGTGLRQETSPPEGTWDEAPYPLPNGGFVFVRHFGLCCQTDLWKQRPGQTAKALTTTTTVQESQPAVSPNGKRIAHLGSGPTGEFLYVMNSNGRHNRQLAPAASFGGVDFSPDGSLLVFAQTLFPPEGPTEGVFFYDFQTDTVSRVGSLESFEAGWGALSFSPDGTRLLIASDSSNGDLLYSTDLTGGDQQYIPVVPPGSPEQDYYFAGGYWQPVP